MFHLNKRYFTGEVLSLVVSLMRQAKVHQHVLHLLLSLRLRPTLQQRVEQDVLLHCETATNKSTVKP